MRFIILTLILTTIFFSGLTQKPLRNSEEFPKLTRGDSTLLVGTWKAFLESIQTKNYYQIKELSLRRVYCTTLGHPLPGLPEKLILPIDSFLDSVLIKFYDKHFSEVLRDSTFRFLVHVDPHLKPSNVKLKIGEKVKLYEVYYSDLVPWYEKTKDQNYYVFQFVKINDLFKFFGVHLESPH